MHKSFFGQSFLTLSDYSGEDILWLVALANQFKYQKKIGKEKQYLQGKTVALIFDKDSTRTRSAFEVAAHNQGANVTYFGPSGSQIGHKESLKDSARVLSGMFDAIQYRGFNHSDLELFTRYSSVPVYNGLTDEFHPTQALADFMTMQAHCHKPVNEINFCYVGDCRFNMTNSLMLLATLLGMNVRFLAPKMLQPNLEIQKKALKIAKKTGAKLLITDNYDLALSGCDFVHTDVWLSMGEPFEKWKERVDLLKFYQVNQSLLDKANNPNVKFMHCLPAIHNRETEIGEKLYQQFGLDGAEVTEQVFESEASLVFEQAENRLHTIKALMVATLSEQCPI